MSTAPKMRRPSRLGVSVARAAVTLLLGVAAVALIAIYGVASFPPPVAATVEAVEVDGGGETRNEESSCPSEGGEGACSSHAADPRDGYVRVYDRVFSPRLLLALADLCLVHSLRYPDQTTFYPRGRPSNVLERAIDTILDTLGDDSPYVEVWSRLSHQNIDAHCDIDESLQDDMGRLIGAEVGHVLYMSLDGAEDNNPIPSMPMPTVVFPDRRVGWDANGTHEGAVPNDPRNVEMVVVPAVPGRLLRFDGRAMHAVPRPADRYFVSERDEIYGIKEMMNDDDDDWTDFPEEEDLDLNEDEARVAEEGAHWYDWKARGLRLGKNGQDGETKVLRFVLLFNTWSKAPPTKVDRDDNKGDMMKEKTDAMLKKKWKGELGPNLEVLTQSINRSNWVEVPIKPPPPRVESVSSKSSSDNVPIRVKLMGKYRRRVHPDSHATLYVDKPTGEVLAGAVRERTQPSRFLLRQKSRTGEGTGSEELL